MLVYARHKVKHFCTLVYCVDFYIHSFCSIFKRRFLEFKIMGEGDYSGAGLCGCAMV